MSIGDKEVKKEAETLRLLVSINKDALFKLSTWSTDDIVDKLGKGFVPTPLAKAIDTLNVECTRILIEEAKVPISHPVSIFFLGRFQTITFSTALEHILLNDEVSFNAYSLSEDDGALKLEFHQAIHIIRSSAIHLFIYLSIIDGMLGHRRDHRSPVRKVDTP